MKAVILAAGEGNRLRPFTVSEPKVMIPVANKPILHFVVDSLVKNGITDITMVVGYQQEKIMSYFGDGGEFNANLNYVKQSKQLGTAHALYKAKNKIDKDFIILPGDNVISEDTVSDLLQNREEYSVLITKSETPSKYGVITMKDGYIQDIEEKPEKSQSHIISTGIYAFPKGVFDYIEQGMNYQIYDLPSVLKKIMKEKEVRGIWTDSKWMDIVYPWNLISVNSMALSKIPKATRGVLEEDVIIKGPVFIGDGALIKGGSYIQGPVIIGEGCQIGPHACILPSTSIGQDCHIAPFTIIKNSMLMKGVEVGPNSNVENSVLNHGVKVKGNFSTLVGDAEKKTKKDYQSVKNIGAMIAEDTIIDSGVVTEPGVIIGSSCIINSGRILQKDIESNSKII